MTLHEKEQLLMTTVALPTGHDWALLTSDEEERHQLVILLNAVLSGALEHVKSERLAGRGMVLGDIAKLVFGRIGELAIRYPRAGLTDSEVYSTVARFWAVNYEPSFFGFFLHPPEGYAVG